MTYLHQILKNNNVSCNEDLLHCPWNPFLFFFPNRNCCHFEAWCFIIKIFFSFCPECGSDSSSDTMISYKQILALFFFRFVPHCLAECAKGPILMTQNACIWGYLVFGTFLL